MRVIWRVAFVFAAVGSCLCVNEIEFEGNYVDNYDNEIFKDHQEGDSSNPPGHADSSHWDKLFISLEDSHMRQNVLLDSIQQCCGGMESLRNHVDKLLKGTFQTPTLVSVCRAQAEQAGLRLYDSLVELRREEAERERRINVTLEMILQGRNEENARLKHFEEAVASLSGLKEKEMTSPEDMDTMKGYLVAIVTDLQRVHLQMSKVMEQTETLRKGRGDT